MRLFQIAIASATILAACPAYGEQSAAPPPGKSKADGPAIRGLSEAALREERARRRFAPMWYPVSKYRPSADANGTPQIPSAAYEPIWHEPWQQELGVSHGQKDALLALRAKALAESDDRAEEFQKLSPEARDAEIKTWAGKSAPWRKELDNQVARQIEAVLKPQQLQTLREFLFPTYIVGLLYDAETRREIGFTADQADRFRRVANERLSRFQAIDLERAEKVWNMLTPEQQGALPEMVKHQGPTSAALSIAWDLGFDIDSYVPGYPMLAEAPVRKRVGLSSEQEKRMQAVTSDSAARKERAWNDRFAGKAQSDRVTAELEAKEQQQVEAMLTPRQLAMLNEIDFRRRVVLALGYPEKRAKVGLSAQQATTLDQLDQVTHERRYRVDRDMLARAVEITTPAQREQLQTKIERQGYGKQ
ncbi:MAG: hypothetical protein WD845_15730 [Pirellulales bacterium]